MKSYLSQISLKEPSLPPQRVILQSINSNLLNRTSQLNDPADRKERIDNCKIDRGINTLWCWIKTGIYNREND